MPYVSVATPLKVGDPLRVRSPVLIPLEALARHSQLNPDDPLARRLSSFLPPQSKYDIQKFQCRVVAPRNSLKSSLKCFRSRRVISEPSTPPSHSSASISSPPTSPKSVHFKDKDGELESVCLFRSTGRPSSISHPRSLSDTETETETETALEVSQCSAVVGATTFTPTYISPIPSPHTPPESNVHLESLTFLPARPPLLRGTIRVRNIAFQKCVTARFTTDGWTTISEAHARYVGPIPAPAFGADPWDMFAFTISLGAPRTLLLAVRYAVPDVGEWWDNNGGADFRVVLAPVTQRPAPIPAVVLGFGVGGVGAIARPRRAVVGACRANVATTKTYGYPMLARPSPPVPSETNH